MYTKKEFHFLFPIGYMHSLKRSTVFSFLAMVPPLVRRLVLIFTLSIIHYSLFTVSYAQDSGTVRVCVMQEVESLRLKVNGHYQVINLNNNKMIYKGEDLNTTVMADKTGIMLGNIRPKITKVLIRPGQDSDILVNNRPFGGAVEFIKADNSKFIVVNVINLEDYVKGISIREISHYWPPETLKAEVIAFRTFAVYKIEESKGKDYDLTSDIYSQVYGGKAAERYRINDAVDQTRGLVITYKGKVIPAFYSATCAGRTEDASVLWNINIEPLKGVACPFCQDSPHFRWHYVASAEEIREKLAAKGYKIKNIKDIVAAGTDASGRITDLKIVCSSGNVLISAKDFRNVIGPNVIKSTNFKINIIAGDIVFQGLGWGHGVGLCQWGAYFMGKEGYKYDQILKYYYPGVEISSLSLVLNP